jgi:hypothetical protein
MKKILFFSILSLFFANQGATLANDGEMRDVDFTQLTCSYLSDEEGDKEKALTKVLADTQSIITETQKQTLEALMTDEMSVDTFCADAQL